MATCTCDCTECFYRDDTFVHSGCQYNCGHTTEDDPPESVP